MGNREFKKMIPSKSITTSCEWSDEYVQFKIIPNNYLIFLLQKRTKGKYYLQFSGVNCSKYTFNITPRYQTIKSYSFPSFQVHIGTDYELTLNFSIFNKPLRMSLRLAREVKSILENMNKQIEILA